VQELNSSLGRVRRHLRAVLSPLRLGARGTAGLGAGKRIDLFRAVESIKPKRICPTHERLRKGMPHGGVAFEQTVCVKGVPKEHAGHVKALLLGASAGIKSIFDTADKAVEHTECVLVYLNYSSAEAAAFGRDEVQRDVMEWWQPAWGSAPSIILKSELVSTYFAVYVEGAPGITPAEVADACKNYANVHPSVGTPVHRNDAAVFLNLQTYSDANKVLKAGGSGCLRLNGAVCRVHEARNTTFVSAVVQAMQDEDRHTYGPEDVSRVRAAMHDKEWPPSSTAMWNILKAASDVFDFAPCNTRFALRDNVVQGASNKSRRLPRLALGTIGADLACETSTTESSAQSPPQTPEERKLAGERKAAVDKLLHESYGMISELFTTFLFLSDEGAGPWMDSMPGSPSASLLKLLQQIGITQMPSRMMRPVADWDLSTLLNAFCNSSAMHALPGPETTIAARGARVCTRVLVKFGILLEDEYQQYLPCFESHDHDPRAALCTIRYIRNLMCHMPGSVHGLSQPTFECVWGLLTGSLRLLATCMGKEHMLVIHKQHASMFEEMCTVNFTDTNLPKVERASIYEWTCDDVVCFFTKHGFPTIGVEIHRINGVLLVLWYQESHARHKFTAPVPCGLGLCASDFDARFRQCLDAEIKRASAACL
jgi:hypothetical protein